jgi:hypothetical protein
MGRSWQKLDGPVRLLVWKEIAKLTFQAGSTKHPETFFRGAITDMAEPQGDLALIGLAVMGQNLILNMNDHGFTVVAYNRTVSKVDEFLADFYPEAPFENCSLRENYAIETHHCKRVPDVQSLNIAFYLHPLKSACKDGETLPLEIQLIVQKKFTLLM